MNWKEFVDIPGSQDPNGTAFSQIQQKLSIHTFVYPRFEEASALTFEVRYSEMEANITLK